jgi:hypothetical protein
MEAQMMWGRRAFFSGLLLMLLSGIASAPSWSLHGQSLALLALVGALTTTAGGFIHARAMRIRRQRAQGQISQAARRPATEPARSRRVA